MTRDEFASSLTARFARGPETRKALRPEFAELFDRIQSDALERAAVVCEGDESSTGRHLAEKIRALKPTKGTDV